jgi:hypothetical protein
VHAITRKGFLGCRTKRGGAKQEQDKIERSHQENLGEIWNGEDKREKEEMDGNIKINKIYRQPPFKIQKGVSRYVLIQQKP